MCSYVYICLLLETTFMTFFPTHYIMVILSRFNSPICISLVSLYMDKLMHVYFNLSEKSFISLFIAVILFHVFLASPPLLPFICFISFWWSPVSSWSFTTESKVYPLVYFLYAHLITQTYAHACTVTHKYMHRYTHIPILGFCHFVVHKNDVIC